MSNILSPNLENIAAIEIHLEERPCAGAVQGLLLRIHLMDVTYTCVIMQHPDKIFEIRLVPVRFVIDAE